MTTSPKNIKTNDSTQTRVALLEQSIGHIGQTLLRIESRIDGLDKSLNARIDNLDKSLGARIDKLDARIDKVENRLWQILFIIVTSIIGIGITKIIQYF